MLRGNIVILLVFGVSLLAPQGCYARFASHEPVVSPVQDDVTRYAILIDGGSTGSKMFIYEIKLNKNGKVDEVSDLDELKNSLGKVRPGFSSFLDKQDEISYYLQKFINEAKKIVPEEKWETTPILVLATAGMRLLQKPDQSAIMDNVREVLKNKNVSPFLYIKDNVKVISGKDEAIFGWITVNFIQGVLTAPRRQASWGTLDLGGASTQNTMFYNRTSPQITPIRIGKKSYRLFAKSYLDTGLARIHERFLEFLVNWDERTEDDDGNIKSPCHHQGFKEAFDVRDQKVGVVGDPNSDVCRDLVDAMLFCTKKTPNQDCPFEDQPKLTGKFIAFSAFYTIIDRIGAVICEDKPVSIQQIGCGAKKYCSKPYNVVKPADEGYTKFSCLWGNYIYELLTKGYQMAPNKRIFVKKELKGYSLSWIIGAVLHQTDLL